MAISSQDQFIILGYYCTKKPGVTAKKIAEFYKQHHSKHDITDSEIVNTIESLLDDYSGQIYSFEDGNEKASKKPKFDTKKRIAFYQDLMATHKNLPHKPYAIAPDLFAPIKNHFEMWYQIMAIFQEDEIKYEDLYFANSQSSNEELVYNQIINDIETEFINDNDLVIPEFIFHDYDKQAPAIQFKPRKNRLKKQVLTWTRRAAVIAIVAGFSSLFLFPNNKATANTLFDVIEALKNIKYMCITTQNGNQSIDRWFNFADLQLAQFRSDGKIRFYSDGKLLMIDTKNNTIKSEPRNTYFTKYKNAAEYIDLVCIKNVAKYSDTKSSLIRINDKTYHKYTINNGKIEIVTDPITNLPHSIKNEGTTSLYHYPEAFPAMSLFCNQ